jgi:chromosome partitioning protein
MITIVIANQKGGVGKTTTAINIATATAASGWRTLLIDLDPQGNASTGLGLAAGDRTNSSYDLLIEGLSPSQCAHPTSIPGLDVVPATQDLSGAEVELVGMENRAGKLREAIGRNGDDARYDVCFIDCPPSLGLLTLNALSAADSLLVPLQCEFFALEGLSQLLQTVDRVQQQFNPGLGIVGIVLTMFDRRNRLTDQVADDVRECLGPLVFESVIPRNVRLSEAPSHGLPALVYDHQCAGSRAYIALARELMGRLPAQRIAA